MYGAIETGGRWIVSPAGINGALSGPTPNVNSVVEQLAQRTQVFANLKQLLVEAGRDRFDLLRRRVSAIVLFGRRPGGDQQMVKPGFANMFPRPGDRVTLVMEQPLD